jgi:hypothetical protein
LQPAIFVSNDCAAAGEPVVVTARLLVDTANHPAESWPRKISGLEQE